MRRILLTAVAMLIPIAGLTLGFAGTAGAAGKISCTTISGTATGTITLGGCSGPNTGGGAHPVSALTLATGGTVTWLSGGSTTIGAPTLTSSVGKTCPGYVKNATSNPTAEAFTAVVTNDNGDGMLIPGAVKGSVCLATNGNITMLKAITFSWAYSALKCTAISGSATGNITVGGCTGGNTGGMSMPLSALTLATGGTINWVSGGSTTIGAPSLVATSAKACPGYVKGATSNPTAENFTATVTKDSGDGLKLPGAAKGAVCLAANGTVTALKALSAK